jgi:glycosyltransferase involved in cell wall biosynthesis
MADRRPRVVFEMSGPHANPEGERMTIGKPTVLFDAAVLGQNRIKATSFTSIARVAQAHLSALAGAGEWDVVLSSSGSVADLHGAARFVAERVDPGRPFRLPLGRATVAAIECARRLVGMTRAGGEGSGETPSPVRSVARGVLAKRAMRELSFPARLMRAARLFHSPLHRFPDRILESPRITRLLTLHDVIGLTHPELVSAQHPGWDRERLDGIRPSDFVLCVSESTRREMLERYPAIQAERTMVAHLAADDAFRPCRDPGILASVRSRYGIPEGDPYLLCLALYDRRKNFHGIVRAFAALCRQGEIPGLRLVMAGAIRMAEAREEAREALADAAAFRGRIHTTGWVAQEDLPALYSGAEAFVFPTYAEGFGLPPLEAMACGTPVVTSNATSIPEVVGDAALQVAPGDGDALAQAILDVHRSRERREAMSRAGLERAKLFSWASFEANTIEAYRLALGD